MAWALPLRHMATLSSAALTSVSACRIGIWANVNADLCRQRLHFGFVANQGGLDETLGCSFDRASERHVRHGPADCRGDGRKGLAALKELVKDVVVGGVANQRVNGNGFGEGG